MAGGYISCGSFAGSDKSGSAFEGVLQGIEQFLPAEEAAQFRRDVIDPIFADGYSEEQTLAILPELVPDLESRLRLYYKHLGRQLRHPAPHEAPELDRTSGLDPVEAKWGKGLGWQYYCAHDLLLACDESNRTGEPIILSFD
jgi:hypothetical protein